MPSFGLKNRQSIAIAALLWALLALAFLIPGIMQVFHVAVRLFTEGNATAKSLAFVGFSAFCLTMHGLFGERAVWRKAKAALFVSIALSMAYGLFLQMLFLNLYGSNVNSYISHVTSCGENWCWEGDFLQHNHVSKTALYFLEKTTGVAPGPLVDNGRPLYEILPWADWAAPLTLLLTAAVFLFGLASVLGERDSLNVLLLSAAVMLFAIASFDGGIFTQTGISAAALLAIYLLRQNRQVGAELRLALPLALASLVAFAPNLLFGSFLTYRDWFPGILAASSFFSFVDAERGWKRVTLLGFFLFSSLFFAAHVYDKAFGPGVAIYRSSKYIEGLPGAPNLVIYGLPPQASLEEVESLVPEINFTAAAKYGWYFVASPNASQPIALTTTQLQARFRQRYPQGYLYVDVNHNAYEFRQAYVVWKQRPERQLDYDELFSMKVLKIDDRGAYTVLSGVTAANGPALALEVGSFLRSRGADAAVITLVV